MRRILTLMSCMAVIATALLDSSTASAQAAPAGGYRGPTRVDFDDRLIKGQTTKADSVYIYDRQQIEIRSLVMKARTFRPKIIRSVFEE
jgi:hypothetical protein